MSRFENAVWREPNAGWEAWLGYLGNMRFLPRR